MRAVVLTRYGSPDVLELQEMRPPEPGPGSVLVRVIASGTNPVEAKIRAAGAWAKIPLPAVIGYDAAGVVEALGPGVMDLAKGDAVYFTPEIFGNPHGTHAEHTVVPASIVARKPSSIGFAEAASIPLAGGTAYEAVVRRLSVGLGDVLLIHGGAGGVGSFAVQLAKAAGARVLATASTANLGVLEKLGADVAIDYTKQDPSEVALKETDGRGVDCVFDCVGGELIAKSVGAVRPFGQMATILSPKGDLSGMQIKNLTLHAVFLTRERARLEALAKLVDQGKVRPLVDQVVPIEGIVDAHRRLDAGHGKGKIVLRLASEA